MPRHVRGRPRQVRRAWRRDSRHGSDQPSEGHLFLATFRPRPPLDKVTQGSFVGLGLRRPRYTGTEVIVELRGGGLFLAQGTVAVCTQQLGVASGHGSTDAVEAL